MAGHFALLGHRVALYARDLTRLGDLPQHRTVRLLEAVEGEGRLALIGDSLPDVLQDADLVMVTTTADAHRGLAMELAPLLAPGQRVVLNPGRTLGAFEFMRVLEAHGRSDVRVGEAQSLLYACRAEAPGRVRVIGVKDRVLFAACPSRHTDELLEVLNAVHPSFVRAPHVLATGLENIGAILHPPVILFNAAAIERGAMFHFYQDMTPAVAGFIEALDAERVAIGAAFGLNVRPLREWVAYAYSGVRGDTLLERMRDNPAYHRILAPDTLRSRLLLEDVPTGIVPMVGLAEVAGVRTPLMDAVWRMTEGLLGEDLGRHGRTLKNLGLEGIGPSELLDQL